MTEVERILWQALRAHRLQGLHFRRQQILEGFIVDFYCHAARLAVEVDGGVHAQRVERDRERDQFLESTGIRVIRFPNEEVMTNLPAVLAAIAAEASPAGVDNDAPSLSPSSDAKPGRSNPRPPTGSRSPFVGESGPG